MRENLKKTNIEFFCSYFGNFDFRLRSEQVPGSEFQPCDESHKINGGFLGPSWFNKKVNREK